MSVQAIPVGVNFNSPVAWLVVAVAAIVFALTISTRRTNLRPREIAPARPHLSTPGSRERYAQEWSAAQAAFVEQPRAGCERARAIVAQALRERGTAAVGTASAAPDYAAAVAVLQRDDASTDDLRLAFTSFRRAFDALS